ncbi:CHAT domain-containing protein [Kitasatospora sp. NPDC097643]|uniref:CHAT domain-containing protein n=1 Tax=Kitasatospora sp. NPDC097643 TaxID=3157230 RepID=UPI0033233130
MLAYAATGEHLRLRRGEALRDRAALLRRAENTPYCETRKAQALGLWAWADVLAGREDQLTVAFTAEWLTMVARYSPLLLPPSLRERAAATSAGDGRWPLAALAGGRTAAVTELRVFLTAGLGWGRTAGETATVGRYDQAKQLLRDGKGPAGVDLLAQVAERLPTGHWLRPTALGVLGAARTGEAARRGRSEPLRRAARAAAEQALAEAPPGHPHRAWFLSVLELASAPVESAAPEGRAELEAALAVGRQAVAVTEAADPDRIQYLTTHLTFLSIRLLGGPDEDGVFGAELEELALRIADDAAAADAAVTQALDSVVSHLTERYRATGDPATLARARRHVERWTRRTAADPERLAAARLAGARLCGIEYQHTGAVARLDEGIALCRAVLAAPGHGLAGADARDLLDSLRGTRRSAVGSSDGLAEPEEPPLVLPGAEELAGDPALTELAARQIRLRRVSALLAAFSRAVQRYVEAWFAGGPPQEPEHRDRAPAVLRAEADVRATAEALLAAVDPEAEPGLVAMVEALREVVTAPGEPDLDALAALGGRLADGGLNVPSDSPTGRALAEYSRAMETGNPWAPGAAEQLRAQLADAVPGGVREAEILAGLVTAGAAQHHETPDPALLADLLSHADRLLAHPAAAPAQLVMTARNAAHAAAGAGDWPAAARLLGFAADSVPLLASPRLGRQDLERVLGRHAFVLGADAAAAALNAGAPPLQALRHLEAARGVLLAGGLAGRTDLGELHREHPVHALELEALLTADHGEDHDRRQADAHAREVLLGRIRRLPGFERLLLPPQDAELLALGAAGPVVTLTSSHLRGTDAILIADGQCTSVRLPDAPLEQVAGWAVELEEITRKREDGAKVYPKKRLVELLDRLWTAVAEPVLAALDLPHRPGQALPRLWWVPTGPFAVLPLHAAGRSADGGQAPAHSLLDRVVSSYAPTLRALHHTRARPPRATARPLLAVEGPGLGLAGQETAEVGRLVRGTDHLDATSTADQVAARLGAYAAVHFSCHGYREAGLALADDTWLTPRQVEALRLDGAQLAYLSACSTALDSTRLLDEPLHVAAAFQLAGYRHVVGTLWPVTEGSAVAVAASFYGDARIPGAPDSRIARALAAAARLRRAERPRDPADWAGYQHIGA